MPDSDPCDLANLRGRNGGGGGRTAESPPIRGARSRRPRRSSERCAAARTPGADTCPASQTFAYLGRIPHREWPRDRIYPRPLSPAQEADSLAFNRQWIREAIEDGEAIHDIGRDPSRVIAGEPMSKWYAAELEEIAANPNARRYQVRLRAEEALRRQAEAAEEARKCR